MKQIILALLFLFQLGINLAVSQIPKELEFRCACENHNSNPSTRSSVSGCFSISESERKYDATFIPSPDYSLYTIQVNLIFVQRNDGSGNFQENDPEHQALWNEIEKRVNVVYQSLVRINDPSCYTGSTYVDDTKIRFKFNRYYIKNELGWDNQGGSVNLCPDRSSWFLNSLDNSIVNNVNIRRGINVYFTENKKVYTDLVVNRTTDTFISDGTACSEFPDFSNYTASSKIHMPDYYTKYWFMKNICPKIYGQLWDPVIKEWYLDMAKGLAHEIGHSLWLFHESPYYGRNQCYNSIMNQSGSSPRNFLPPSEVGRMHASLSLSNVRTFVDKNTFNPVPLKISTTDNWNFQTRLFQDLSIISGGNLTLSCKLEFIEKGDLIINNNGKMVLDHSVINSSTANWAGGVHVNSGGSLVMKNNAIIEKGAKGFIVDLGGTFECTEGEIR